MLPVAGMPGMRAFTVAGWGEGLTEGTVLLTLRRKEAGTPAAPSAHTKYRPRGPTHFQAAEGMLRTTSA